MSELDDLIENTCSPSEMQRRIEDTKAYFARMKPDEYRKQQADARALWAVRVLDAWAAADDERYVAVGPCYGTMQWYCTLWHTEKKREGGPYHAATPDAARIAAAEAIEAGR